MQHTANFHAIVDQSDRAELQRGRCGSWDIYSIALPAISDRRGLDDIHPEGGRAAFVHSDRDWLRSDHRRCSGGRSQPCLIMSSDGSSRQRLGVEGDFIETSRK